MAARKSPAKTATKKKALDPLFDFPCTTTWYNVNTLTPPEEVWCLVKGVDEEGQVTIHMARIDKKTKTWLTPTDIALQAAEAIESYSPIFQQDGSIWRSD